MPSRRASRRASRRQSHVVDEGLAGLSVCDGRFQLTGKVLGRGCFCCVVEALPATALQAGEPVAVKVFSEEQDDDDGPSIFVREVHALQKLLEAGGSKYVVDLIDFSKNERGEAWAHSDGHSFLVLEIGSVTLEQWADEHRRALGVLGWLPLQRLREPLVSAARCLEHLEALGHVHLDFKPENLLLCGSEWKLIDLDGCCAVGTILTAEDVVVTPVHCAPELAKLYAEEDEGASATACIASHAWSFGSVAVELMTGASPLQAKYDVLSANGLNDDEDGICMDYFAWLAQATPEEVKIPNRLSQHASKEVFDLLTACLHIEPSCRPAMAVVHATLSPVSAKHSTSADATTVPMEEALKAPADTSPNMSQSALAHQSSWWGCCCAPLALEPGKRVRSKKE